MSLDFTANLNDNGFQNTLKSMVRGSVTAADKIDGVLGSISSSPAAGALIGAFSGAAVGLAIKGSLDFAGALQDQSDALNVNVEKLQGLQGAFAQSGGDAEKVAQALGKLNVAQQGAAAGSGELQSAFKTLGITAANLREDSTDELLLKMADGFGTASDRGKAYAATIQILGKSGKALAAGLAGGREELERQIEATTKLSKEEIASLDNAGDAWTRFANTVKVSAAKGVNAIMSLYEMSPDGISGNNAGDRLGAGIRAAFDPHDDDDVISTGPASQAEVDAKRAEVTKRRNQKKWADLRRSLAEDDPSEGFTKEEEGVDNARKSDLQKQVEDGNKIFMESEEKKRAEKKKSADADVKLDEDLAKGQKSQLQKQVEDGNKLFLESEEKKRQAKKQAAKDNLAQSYAAMDTAVGNYESAVSKQHDFDRMSPNERRESIRAQRRDEAINRRRARIDSNPQVHEARSGSGRLNREVAATIKNIKELAAAITQDLSKLIAAP